MPTPSSTAGPTIMRASWPPPMTPTTGDTTSSLARGKPPGGGGYYGSFVDSPPFGRPRVARLVQLIRFLWDRLVRYALKFGVVGLAGYFIDVGIFNALRLGALGGGHFFQGPLGAKIVSVTIATLATWFGNRYWTFREHRRKNFVLELFEFGVVSLGGL